MSYNILADQYAQEHSRDLYSSVPFRVLEWGTRAALISKEVAHWSPDVVCLQEVDHYRQLERLLERHGYKGTYEQRTGGRPDGLATFWKRCKFEVEARRRIEYAPMGLKDNVAQLTVLRSRDGGNVKDYGPSTSSNTNSSMSASAQHVYFASDSDCEGGSGVQQPQPNSGGGGTESSRRLVIANIHVLFNPKRGDIKLAQVRTMLEEAERMAAATDKSSGRASPPCPVVVCGDFNSAAGSALYNFVTQGELDLRSTERRRVSGQVEVAGRSGWPSIQHGFLSALAGDAVTEEEALAAAVGTLPVYNSLTDPHSSLREPQLLRSDAATEALSAPQNTITTPPWALHRGDSGVSSSSSSSRGSKAPRLWAEEELRMAVGSNSSNGEPVSSIVQHPLELHSAYRSVTGAEPLYTTVHDRYVGTVDYIFYTPQAPGAMNTEEAAQLRPLRVLRPPPLRTLHHGLPCLSWPSDHVCLLADFELTNAEA